MSYDFELFVNRPISIVPPSTSATCNVSVDGPYKVEPEDLPTMYLNVVGKKRNMFRIQLEGQLDSSDYEIVDRWLSQIVGQTKGVLIDLQAEQFRTTKKSGTLEAAADSPNDSGNMTLYFSDGEAFFETGFESMLETISLLMPEAAPVRFGHFEPLQGRIQNGNYVELVSSFKNETDIFMKSKSPFGHIFLSLPCKKTFERYHPQHWFRRKFLLGKLSFEIRPVLFSNPENFERLIRLFEALCVSLDVVYAQISEDEHFGSWEWFGLPDNAPHTICVGSTYQTVWPEILEVGRKIGGHHRIVTTDRFGRKPPEPPESLIGPNQDDHPIDPKTGKLRDTRDIEPKYAQIFPFDYKFDLNRYIW